MDNIGGVKAALPTETPLSTSCNRCVGYKETNESTLRLIEDQILNRNFGALRYILEHAITDGFRFSYNESHETSSLCEERMFFIGKDIRQTCETHFDFIKEHRDGLKKANAEFFDILWDGMGLMYRVVEPEAFCSNLRMMIYGKNEEKFNSLMSAVINEGYTIKFNPCQPQSVLEDKQITLGEDTINTMQKQLKWIEGLDSRCDGFVKQLRAAINGLFCSKLKEAVAKKNEESFIKLFQPSDENGSSFKFIDNPTTDAQSLEPHIIDRDTIDILENNLDWLKGLNIKNFPYEALDGVLKARWKTIDAMKFPNQVMDAISTGRVDRFLALLAAARTEGKRISFDTTDGSRSSVKFSVSVRCEGANPRPEGPVSRETLQPPLPGPNPEFVRTENPTTIVIAHDALTAIKKSQQGLFGTGVLTAIEKEPGEYPQSSEDVDGEDPLPLNLLFISALDSI